MAGQMTVILFGSLMLLITIQLMLKISQRDTVIEVANRSWMKDRIASQINIPTYLNIPEYRQFITQTSSCHEGYIFSEKAYKFSHHSKETRQLESSLSKDLNWNIQQIKIGYATLTKNDFSYSKCSDGLMEFPMNGIVISIKLSDGNWISSEVHNHHLHFDDLISSTQDSIIAFFIIAMIAITFISKLTKPMNNLSKAAQKFAQGLNVSEINETGPPDIKRTIQSFNVMQRQVKEEVKKHTDMLAAMSHDIRTPLTALRIKAELVNSQQERESLIASIEKMEKITTSALEYLKGESRTEMIKNVDLAVLLESECNDFSEAGSNVRYIGMPSVLQKCRPEALTRAVRNLIDNAVKYGGSATVDLSASPETVTLSVIDQGPGISEKQIDYVMEPFTRLSKARESNDGGFGLGLAITKSIAEGHNTTLKIKNNATGLIASITLNREL